MKQPKTPENNQAPKKQTTPTIKSDVKIPEDREPQPKDYDEIEY